MDNLDDKKWKTLWQKEKLHVLCNFFKKPSAAEASENVYMRERVKLEMCWNNSNATVMTVVYFFCF